MTTYEQGINKPSLREFLAGIYKSMPPDLYTQTIGFNGTVAFNVNCKTQDIDTMVEAVELHRNDPRTNIYFRASALREKPTGKKRGGEDITAGTSLLYCDLDVYNTNKSKAEALDALENFTPAPSFIVDTVRGIQAGWELREFCTDLHLIKAVNKWIEQKFKAFGADSVGDLARVLRMPTTFNHKKEPLEVASILVWRPDRVYNIGDFNWEHVEETVFGEPIEAESLPPNFLRDISSLRRNGELLYKRIFSEETARESGAKKTDGGDTIDRSENDWFITKTMLSMGYTKGQVMTVLTHPEWFSGSRFRQQKNYDYINRTVQGAAFKQGGNTSQYFELVGLSKTPKFIHSKMYDAIVRDGTRFLRLTGEGDVLVDGIWYYHNGIYRRTGAQFIGEEIVARLGKSWAPRYADEVIKYTRVLRDIPTYSIGNEPVHHKLDACVVNTLSGLLQVSTGEVQPHTSDHVSFTQIPVHYDPSRGPGVIDTFIREMLPADTVDVFWEFIGYCLLEDCRFKKALHFVGERDTGKSTVSDLIKRFLGSYNTVAISLQDLVDSKYETASLLHKLANIYSDLSATELKGAGLLKGVVSGDPIRAERKYENSFFFKPFAKHIYSANALVPVADNEIDAYVERWIIIPLSNVFRALPQETKRDGIHEPNTTIIDTLVIPENLSEMLNLSLDGLRRLLKQNRFTYSATVVEEGRKYRAMLDSTYAFMMKETEPDTEKEINLQSPIPKVYLLHSYGIWCGGDDNRRAVGEPKFFARMKTLRRELGITEEKRDIVRTGETEAKPTNVFVGRRWKKESVFNPDRKREEEERRQQQNNRLNSEQGSSPLNIGIITKKPVGRNW